MEQKNDVQKIIPDIMVYYVKESRNPSTLEVKLESRYVIGGKKKDIEHVLSFNDLKTIYNSDTEKAIREKILQVHGFSS